MSSSKKYKKKLVFVTSRFPYPLEKGDKLRAYFQIRELSKSYDIYLISLKENKVEANAEKELGKYCKEIHTFQLPFIAKWLMTFLFLFGNKPLQVGYFYNPLVKSKIKKLLLKIAPDLIYCQLIRAANYVKDYHDCPKVLDYMDALSKGIERRIEYSVGFKKWILNTEYNRLKTYENIIFEYFELHTVISEEDRKNIFHPEYESIKVIPNGVNEYFFQAPKIKKKIDVLFTGNMSYPPNVRAAKFIANKIAPKAPHLNFYIVGANPTQELKRINGKNIVVTGWVEDIREYYAKSKIFLAPMTIGTGLQNKLLEAMACGIPCVTTTLANKALKAKPDEEIILADEENKIVEKLIALSNDEELQGKIAKNGQSYIRKNFDWENTTGLLIREIESLQ